MRRRLGLFMAPLAASLLAACGSTQPLASGDVGTSCPRRPGVHRDPGSLSDLLARRVVGATYWLRVDEPGQLSPSGRDAGDGAPRAITLADPVRLGATPARTSLRVPGRVVREAASELSRGGSVVLVAGDVEDAHAVASIRADGSVAFLGECAAGPTGTFARFAGHRRAKGDARSAGELLTALAGDDRLLAALKAFEHPAPKRVRWEDLKPTERFIDPDGQPAVPTSVAADLDARWVHYRFPASWKTFDATLATFVPGVGWNAGVPLWLDSPDPAAVSYVSRTKPLELWLVSQTPAGFRPLARVGVLPAGQAGEDVRLTSRAEATSLDALVRRARSGKPLFTSAR